jgi:RNA polymerase sigma-70 factor, ECF subfamily
LSVEAGHNLTEFLTTDEEQADRPDKQAVQRSFHPIHGPTSAQPMEAPTDWELVRQFRTDPPGIFATIVKRHYSLVANLCYKFFLESEPAQDATQDIFLHVYQSLNKVEERGQPFSHWLCRVATNHCRNVYRQNKREQRLLDEKQMDVADHGAFLAPPPDWGVQRRETAATIHKALAKIKPEERLTLVLSEMSDMDVGEVADITGVAEHKVRRRLRRAKTKLRKIMVQEKVIRDAAA